MQRREFIRFCAAGAATGAAPVAAIVWPPLTTVHQPVKVLGQRAVELLVARLTGANAAPEPVFQQLEHAVVSRQTTSINSHQYISWTIRPLAFNPFD